MSAVSNMYDRIGHFGGHLHQRVPQNFSALVLPERIILRAKGVSDSAAPWGQTRDHPFARWQTHSFPRGTSVDEALAQVENFNAQNPRVTKVRLSFTDGTHIMLARGKPQEPNTLKAIGTYGPSEVFTERTASVAAEERAVAQKQMESLVDSRGHLLHKRPGTPSHFSSVKLFADCPVAAAQQPGFAFTPVGYNSFMVRPSYQLPGCRPGVGTFNESAVNFRPRGFNTPKFPNHDEIGGRNEVSQPRLARAGRDVYTGSFMRSSSSRGAPLSPERLRNTATAPSVKHGSPYHHRLNGSDVMNLSGDSGAPRPPGGDVRSTQSADGSVTSSPISPVRVQHAEGSSTHHFSPGGKVRVVANGKPGNGKGPRAASAAPAASRFYSEGTQTPLPA